MPKTVAIIQARSTSKRLPGKMMMDIAGKPVLERVINRLKAVKVLAPQLEVDIVVATSTNKEDDLIEQCGQKNCVKVFRGSETNVLDRFYHCAIKYKADWILRICGDCPLISPLLVYGLLTKTPRKHYQALAVNRGGIVDGQDAELFSFQELERVYKRGECDEHVTTKMRTAGSDAEDYGLPFDYKGVKLSLDNKDDMERLQNYVEFL